MRRQEFDFELPESLIAQSPPATRSAARLLKVGAEGCSDELIPDFPNWVRPEDVVICNDTRVIPARLGARKETGGRVELLLERVLSERRALVQIRASKSPKPGTQLLLEGGGRAEVLGRQGPFFELSFLLDDSLVGYLERHGHVPLPPYIQRADTKADRERYQTVFARHAGAVAAPTAGLHFDHNLMQQVRARGAAIQYLTLHVGAGTFSPMRVDELSEHQMHSEWFCVSPELVAEVEKSRHAGGRVIAVGTTVVRALEAASSGGSLAPYEGETDIFIYPGYRFRTVDALLTNFHLPQSTLLMLVCAFAGTDRVLSAYRHAVAKGYRFFSYGDGMFLERDDEL